MAANVAGTFLKEAAVNEVTIPEDAWLSASSMNFLWRFLPFLSGDIVSSFGHAWES